MRRSTHNQLSWRAISACLLLAGLVRAYPELFVENGLAADCSSQPARGYGAHRAPVQDRAITFELTTAADATPAAAVCPGVEYTLTISYGGDSRRALVSTTEGTLGNSTDKTCPNRAYSRSSSDAFTDTLTLGCGSKGRTLEIKVTSAGGKTDAFHQATTTLPIKAVADCPGSTCQGAPAAAAAAPAASSSIPAAAAAAANKNTAQQQRSGSSSGGSCAQSSYGYACKVNLKDGAVLHYTKGGEVPPSNPCTDTAQKSALTATAGNSGEPVHFLLESPLSGYAGLGFPATVNKMNPADAVIGYVDAATAQPQVSAYHLTDYNVNPSATNFNGLSWASNMGAASRGSTGGTLLCFSRMTDATSAQQSKALNLDAINLNYVGHDTTAFEPSQHKLTGWSTLNLNSGTATGSAVSGESERRLRAAVAHGALMLLAFIVFFPLGALAARHKWLAGDKQKGGLGASWFHAHRTFQMLALLLSLAGFILALVMFNVSWRLDGPTPHKLYDLHRIMGILVMAFVVIQAAAGLARPKLSSSYRPAWRFGHLLLGWLTTALGIVVVFIGVVMMHDLRQQAWVNWLLPVVLLLGLLVIAGLVLEVRKHKLEQADRYRPTTHYYGEAGKDGGVPPVSSDMKPARDSSEKLQSLNVTSTMV